MLGKVTNFEEWVAWLRLQTDLLTSLLPEWFIALHFAAKNQNRTLKNNCIRTGVADPGEVDLESV